MRQRVCGNPVPGRLHMQVRVALPDGSGVGIGKDLMPPLRQALEQRKADQPIPMRLVIGEKLRGAVDKYR